MEELKADGKFYHKNCFKCTNCDAIMKLGSYASMDGTKKNRILENYDTYFPKKISFFLQAKPIVKLASSNSSRAKETIPRVLEILLHNNNTKPNKTNERKNFSSKKRKTSCIMFFFAFLCYVNKPTSSKQYQKFFFY